LQRECQGFNSSLVQAPGVCAGAAGLWRSSFDAHGRNHSCERPLFGCLCLNLADGACWWVQISHNRRTHTPKSSTQHPNWNRCQRGNSCLSKSIFQVVLSRHPASCAVCAPMTLEHCENKCSSCEHTPSQVFTQEKHEGMLAFANIALLHDRGSETQGC